MDKSVEQALVLVGGRASRLKNDGVSVASSKAFLDFHGKPLLYWNLYILHRSGIRRLVIAAHEVGLLHKASSIIKSLPCRFTHVDYFQDEGNGVHGIPYE